MSALTLLLPELLLGGDELLALLVLVGGGFAMPAPPLSGVELPLSEKHPATTAT